MYDVVIIGAGPCGIFSAYKIMQEGKNDVEATKAGECGK